MEDIRTQQKEALEVALDYSIRLEKAIITILDELRGERKEDTKEYLDEIINGVNWMLQVINRTLPLLNEGTNIINKDEVNHKVTTFGLALSEKNDNNIADALETEILTTIKMFKKSAKEFLANQ